MDDLRAYAARQQEVRLLSLAELYRMRIASRLKSAHHKRIAEASGLDADEVLFALEVMAEASWVVQERFHWRISPAGCAEFERSLHDGAHHA
ncbi:MAG: hypothetical protein ACK4IT_05405 [Thioalkalivibrionaceae bacterium]